MERIDQLILARKIYLEYDQNGHKDYFFLWLSDKIAEEANSNDVFDDII